MDVDKDEYIKSLEEENEHMRNVLIGKYKSKARALNDEIDDYHLTCDDVGIRGGCGSSCPVFLRGKCGEPDEIIEGMEADLLEAKDSYQNPADKSE